IQKLRELAPALNVTADRAVKIVQEVETALNELSIGVAAEVQVGRVREGVGRKIWLKKLVYCRVEGKFRIAVREELHIGDDDEAKLDEEELTPWAEAARDDKLETFPFVEKLLLQIVENAKGLSEKAEAAQASIRQILNPTSAPADSATEERRQTM